MLELKNYRKEYGSHLILKLDTLLIPKGVSWFQGVNGSGKSTFFKSVAGIIPFQGQIILNDELEIQKDPVAFRKVVNYSYAEPRYPEFLSGLEIIKYHQKIYRSDLKEVEELISEMGVKSYYRSKIGTYSSGMLKKISLIAAMIGSPKLLLLDEPLTTIDSDSQSILLEYLSTLNLSILIASHHALPVSKLQVNHHFIVENKTIQKKS